MTFLGLNTAATNKLYRKDDAAFHLKILAV